ncbi:hypothetical protein [Microcoleus sp.]|uniref:hypothetical protein n=1 Tax=Microcoleus sp. TaxID=44472 RepID=UPI003523E7F7
MLKTLEVLFSLTLCVSLVLNNVWVIGNVINQLSRRSNPIDEPITQPNKKTTRTNRLLRNTKKSVTLNSIGRLKQSINDMNNTPPITNIIAKSSTSKMASVAIPPTPNHIPANIPKIQITPRLVEASFIALTVKIARLQFKLKKMIIVRYLAVRSLNSDKNISFSISIDPKVMAHKIIVNTMLDDIYSASTKQLIDLRITIQVNSVMNMTTITCKSKPVIME